MTQSILHAPKNTLPHIDELYLFVSTDEGGEGICGVPTMTSTLPMVAADLKRVESLRPWAEKIAGLTGRTVRLVKFSKRELVEEFNPDGRH